MAMKNKLLMALAALGLVAAVACGTSAAQTGVSDLGAAPSTTETAAATTPSPKSTSAPTTEDTAPRPTTSQPEVTPAAGMSASSQATPLVKKFNNGATYNVGLNKAINYCQADADIAIAAMPGGKPLASLQDKGTLFTIPYYDGTSTPINPAWGSETIQVGDFNGNTPLASSNYHTPQNVLINGADQTEVLTYRTLESDTSQTGTWPLVTK